MRDYSGEELAGCAGFIATVSAAPSWEIREPQLMWKIRCKVGPVL